MAGFNNILEKDVTSLHQRSAIFIGSENMVLKAEELMREFSTKPSIENTEPDLEKSA
mgnify:CR=1 FL=1